MFRYLLFVFFILFLGSCHSFEGEQEIPVFIHIDKVVLADNPDINEGPLDIEMDDVDLYVENDYLGTYELPADIPVLASSRHTIKVKPGIKLNGYSATRVVYPFLETYEKEVDLKIDSLVNMTPEVRYYSNTAFLWMETFEDQGSSLVQMQGSDVSMSILSSPEYDSIRGNVNGVVYLDSPHPRAELSTNYQEGIGYPVPGNNIPVFVEVSYQSNNEFGIGILVNSGGVDKEEPVAMVYPSHGEWKRIYVNLTPAILKYTHPQYINVWFHATLNEGVEQAVIKLDNFKLVTKSL